MKKLLIIALSLSLFGVRLSAQQEIMMSQYMFNGIMLNPAYAGTHPYWSATAMHRSQWVQFDESPVTQTIAVDGPLGANREVGIGLTLSNDALGIISQQEIGINGSYKIQAGPGTLSFGLRGTFGVYSANVTDAVIWDENDPLYQANISGQLVPKIGTGLYYYTSKWFAGVAVPVLYAADNNVLGETSLAERYFTNHMYLNGGVVFTPSPSIAVKPTMLIKYEAGAPLQADINCSVLMMNRLWAGLGYRTGDALLGMVEWNITPQLRLGYAYDFTLTDIADYSSGSHEIMLGFDFGKEAAVKIRSPRYF